MLQTRNSRAAWMNVAAAFAMGAAIAWAIGTSAQRMRRMSAPISDDVVRERVRARVGEIVSRPEAIEVTVENGVVRLAGEVPVEERDALLTQLLYLPGVMRLRNALGTV